MRWLLKCCKVLFKNLLTYKTTEFIQSVLKHKEMEKSEKATYSPLVVWSLELSICNQMLLFIVLCKFKLLFYLQNWKVNVYKEWVV